MLMPYTLEIIASTVADARAAAAGGADSLELCVALEQDGLTMPLPIIRAIRDVVTLPLNVLLRPHARDFVYTPAEIDRLQQQIEALKPLGIQTIVFGAHTPAREMDIDLVRAFARAAAPVPLTLHRALDSCQHPDDALQALSQDVVRVLTSGAAPTAWEGHSKLAEWVQQYGDRVRFAVASKVNLETIPLLTKSIRAPEYHVGSGARKQGIVSEELVRSLKSALLAAGS
jgi:copper homeostasis protein